MAKVKGDRYGRKVTGEFNLFWLLIPAAWLLTVQPSLFSYEALGIVVAGFVIGTVMDLIVAFIIFALASNSR